MAGALRDGPQAFAPIVWRYKEIVFGVVLGRLGHFEDAQDITQGVFIEAWQRLEKLADPARLGPWLRSIALHRSIDHMRRRESHVRGLDDELLSPEATQDERLEQAELQQQVRLAVESLSSTLRETVALYYLSGYKQSEVARILEVPVGTVKHRLHVARQKLSEALLEMVGEMLKDHTPNEDFAERVFELLNLHGKSGHPDWSGVDAELRKIGAAGTEGFIRAFAQPHARTRTFALHHLEHGSPDANEVLIELLKEGLRDSNKKVRRIAAGNLMRVDVPEQRKREEFVPLVSSLLTDPSVGVRRAVATHWIIGDLIYEYPLEKVVVAMAQENDPPTREKMEEVARTIAERRLSCEHN